MKRLPKNSDHCVIFRHITGYVIAAGISPDMHEGHFQTKKEASLAARAFQISRKADPNFVLDLTNVGPEELGEYIR